MAFTRKTAIVAQRRKGTDDDPFVNITETFVVKENKVLLSEVPDRFNKVLVKDNSNGKVYFEVFDDSVLDADHYRVDYSMGFVEFANSENNKALEFSYSGTGIYLFPASRVWTKLNLSNNVAQTLEDMLTIDGLNEMAQIIDNSELIKIGQKFTTVGYYEAEDGGQAEYLIEDVEYPWSIPLGGGKFANIQNKDYVSYRMFGAKLDGTVDDTPLIKKAHLYADSNYYFDSNNAKVFTCDVVNHKGIIHITDTIRCSSNVDLSGSTLIVDDESSAWFGSYVWGQNASEHYSINPNSEMKASLKEGRFKLDGMTSLPPNTVLAMEETHYEIRDDDGYLYDVNKGELMVHRQKGSFPHKRG